MIPLDNPDLFDVSRTLLAEFAGTRYQGRFVQILLGLKCFGGEVPTLGNGWIGTGRLEELLDDLYSKQSRPANDRVISLFSNSFLRSTGHLGEEHQTNANNWRNNFNAQKGISCYATEAELRNLDFLQANRADCPYLVHGETAPLVGGHCVFHPEARYRGEDHLKVLRKDPETGGFATIDLSNSGYLQRIFLNRHAQRIPIIPLICAIYTDARIASGRREVDTFDFCVDFDLSPQEYGAYFEEDPNCSAHRSISQQFPDVTFTPLQQPLPMPAARPGVRRRQRPGLVGAPVPANVIQPPVAGHGFAAEQVVERFLAETGWTVINRSRQNVGFDLEASNNGRTIYVEVKSSVARCHPTLTENEWGAAQNLGSNYILAIVEGFDPRQPASISWIRNPAKLRSNRRNVVQIDIARSVWTLAARNFGSL